MHSSELEEAAHNVPITEHMRSVAAGSRRDENIDVTDLRLSTIFSHVFNYPKKDVLKFTHKKGKEPYSANCIVLFHLYTRNMHIYYY